MKKVIAVLNEPQLSQFHFLGNFLKCDDQEIHLVRLDRNTIDSTDLSCYDHVLTSEFSEIGNTGYSFNPVNHTHTFIRHPKPTQQDNINYAIDRIVSDGWSVFTKVESSRVTYDSSGNYVAFTGNWVDRSVIVKPINGARSLGVMIVPPETNLRLFLIELRKLVLVPDITDTSLFEFCHQNNVQLKDVEVRAVNEHCLNIRNGIMLQEYIPEIVKEFRILQFSRNFIILERGNKHGSRELNQVIPNEPHTLMIDQLHSMDLQLHGSYDIAQLPDGKLIILEYQPQYGHNHVPTEIHRTYMKNFLMSLPV